MTDTIRVMLVDDHDMVRKGLGVFLKVKADLELVGEARDGKEAIGLVESVQPDVILMDLVMPEMDGAKATRIINQRWPDIKVIALTSFGEQKLIKDALDAGAMGYLLKNISIDELATAIRAVNSGQSILSPEAMQLLVQAQSPSVKPDPDYELTPREFEVLSLLVDGLNNREIAEHLVVSRSTVKAHVSNILDKLSVSNRAEAVALAVRQGLIS